MRTTRGWVGSARVVRRGMLLGLVALGALGHQAAWAQDTITIAGAHGAGSGPPVPEAPIA